MAGEEVFVNYGYSLEDAPAWYKEQYWRSVGHIREQEAGRGH